MIQVGNEGGFLPAPVVLANTPIGFERNGKNIVVTNVKEKTLFLGPAERADVIIDFSQFAGKTIILYNDGPAAVPVADSRVDYYTDELDQINSGGTTTTRAGIWPEYPHHHGLPRRRPRQRHCLRLGGAQGRVHDNGHSDGVFKHNQDPIIVPQAAYNSAYNAAFPQRRRPAPTRGSTALR